MLINSDDSRSFILDSRTDTIGVVEYFLSGILSGLIAYMTAEDRNATFKSVNSLQLANITATSGQLIGASYIEEVFKGRGPGKMPPVSQLIDWCNARGIPRSKAWIIAKHISEYGTKLYRDGGQTNNILTRLLTPEKIDEFAKSIATVMAVKVTSEIQGIFA